MRNPLIEAILENEGVEYEYLDSIPTSDIDRQKSGGNQSRHEPIIRENVANMRQSIRAGVDLFALVAYEDRPGVLVLMDGNNRLSAMDAEGVKTTDIYRVRTDDASRRIALTYAINPTNGVPTPPEQQALQAVNLLAHGYSPARTAEILGVTKGFVQDSKVDAQGLERSRRVGVINQWGKIESRATRVALMKTILLDSVFLNAVRWVAAFDVPHNKVKPILDEIKRETSERGQLALLTEAAKNSKAERDGKKRKKGNPNGQPVHVLFRAQSTGVIRTPVAAFVGMDDVQRRTMLDAINEGRKHLDEVEREIRAQSNGS